MKLPKVTVIDYGVGNLLSVKRGLEKCGAKVIFTSDPKLILSAERVVLPGVGAFGDCMLGLERVPGMKEAIEETVLAIGKPFLGICVGMQLMATIGNENGRHKGLSWIEGEVMPLPRGAWKVPHMGWNELAISKEHFVFRDIPEQTDFYFVHSYHFECQNAGHCLATTDYCVPICSVVGRDNILGVQFHPEKSQSQGIRFLANFLSWRP